MVAFGIEEAEMRVLDDMLLCCGVEWGWWKEEELIRGEFCGGIMTSFAFELPTIILRHLATNVRIEGKHMEGEGVDV